MEGNIQYLWTYCIFYKNSKLLKTNHTQDSYTYMLFCDSASSISLLTISFCFCNSSIWSSHFLSSSLKEVEHIIQRAKPFTLTLISMSNENTTNTQISRLYFICPLKVYFLCSKYFINLLRTFQYSYYPLPIKSIQFPFNYYKFEGDQFRPNWESHLLGLWI